MDKFSVCLYNCANRSDLEVIGIICAGSSKNTHRSALHLSNLPLLSRLNVWGRTVEICSFTIFPSIYRLLCIYYFYFCLYLFLKRLKQRWVTRN